MELVNVSYPRITEDFFKALKIVTFDFIPNAFTGFSEVDLPDDRKYILYHNTFSENILEDLGSLIFFICLLLGIFILANAARYLVCSKKTKDRLEKVAKLGLSLTLVIFSTFYILIIITTFLQLR